MDPVKKFVRTKEDFVCSVCGLTVLGNGYTDHCPKCLFSKHVDINPGDRQAGCGGLMEPIDACQEKREWKIQYVCQKCGYKRKNKTAPEDDFTKIIKLSTHTI